MFRNVNADVTISQMIKFTKDPSPITITIRVLNRKLVFKFFRPAAHNRGIQTVLKPARYPDFFFFLDLENQYFLK